VPKSKITAVSPVLGASEAVWAFIPKRGRPFVVCPLFVVLEPLEYLRSEKSII
jgi:hypothetical protein